MTCIHHYSIVQNRFTIPTEQDSVPICCSYLDQPRESTHSCLCQKGNFVVAVSMQNIKDPDVMHSHCRSTSKLGNQSNTLKMAETERSAWVSSSSLLLHPLATFTGGAMVPMRTSVDKIQRASPVCHQKRLNSLLSSAGYWKGRMAPRREGYSCPCKSKETKALESQDSFPNSPFTHFEILWG